MEFGQHKLSVVIILARITLGDENQALHAGIPVHIIIGPIVTRASAIAKRYDREYC